MKWFQEQGWEVHVAANGDMELPNVDMKFNIPIQRSPFDIKNINAYRKLKGIMDRNNYNLIHCHTPMGSVLSRLAARNISEMKTPLLYTAHGFHFYKGSSIINWLLFYPVERWLAKYTDCLITINEEDYQYAKKFKCKSVKKVNGVGVDIEKFKPISELEKKELKEQYGFAKDDVLLLYAAELSDRKNQSILIDAITIIKERYPKIRLLLAGEGVNKGLYQKLVSEKKANENVLFLGFRKDIKNLIGLSDIAVSSSKIEGLPVNIIENMASGMPIIASKVRGHIDLINHGENGYLISSSKKTPESFANFIIDLYENDRELKQFGIKSRELVRKYSIENVMEDMTLIYSNYM
jgi:glycosyltransferase EpsD